jgi:hypothetical protein
VAQNYCNFYSSVRGLLPGISIVNFRCAYPQAVLSNYGVGTAPSYAETGTLGHEDAAYLAKPGISGSPAGAFSITSTIPSAPDTRMARTPRQTAQTAAALHSASSFEF